LIGYGPFLTGRANAIDGAKFTQELEQMRTRIFLLLALIGASAPSSAAMISFNGSFSQQNPPSAATGRCAPAGRTVTYGPSIAPVSGTSDLGDFLPSGSHCIDPATGSYFDGLFSFDFGSGDVIEGIYSGALSPTANPQQFANLQSFSVTGGTGRFGGAVGIFTGIGTVTFAPGALPSSFETITGRINIPSVPEPTTWSSMLLGFAAIGLARRRNGQKAVTARCQSGATAA
jgi:hypothetical protein